MLTCYTELVTHLLTRRQGMVELEQEVILPEEFNINQGIELDQVFASVREEIRQGDTISLEEYIQTRNVPSQPIIQHVSGYSSEAY